MLVLTMDTHMSPTWAWKINPSTLSSNRHRLYERSPGVVCKLVYRRVLILHPDSELALASLQTELVDFKKWKGGMLGGLIAYQKWGRPALKSQAYMSYSQPATPGDNQVNECFFSRLKAERGEMFVEAKKDLRSTASTDQPDNCLLQHRKVSYKHWVSNTCSVYLTVDRSSHPWTS